MKRKLTILLVLGVALCSMSLTEKGKLHRTPVTLSYCVFDNQTSTAVSITTPSQVYNVPANAAADGPVTYDDVDGMTIGVKYNTVPSGGCYAHIYSDGSLVTTYHITTTFVYVYYGTINPTTSVGVVCDYTP